MLTGHYEVLLVLVSVLVAVFASYTALSLAGRIFDAKAESLSWWIAGGAFAMGTGIWAMHFVGMLAFRLPIPLGYDLPITLLSWILPVVVSALALWQLRQTRLGWRQLTIPAVLLGLGINAMHYVGMAALRMDPGIVYRPWLVATSIVIAIGAAGVSLWIASRLRENSTPHLVLQRSAAALVMGFAIVGMHYTGMGAADFPVGSICRAATGRFITLNQLALLVTVATLSLLAIALLTSVYDARLKARSQVLQLSEEVASERQVLLDRERAARTEAEQLSALKDEFLATLSHELRTPLNAILGWVQLLRIKKDEESLRKGLETIERNARLQARLIDDLLDMSRIVSGTVRLEPELIDATAVVESAVEAVRPAAFSKEIELEARLDRHIGKVWADPSRLQQVMWNLLTNATKFTPSGGRITVTLSAEGDQIVFRVSDTGVGIPEHFIPYLFQRFRQVDSSTTRRHGGLGLGLAIVRQLVDLHGGTVCAASEGQSRGSTFTVRLPSQGARNSASPDHGPSRHKGNGPIALAFTPSDFAGKTILVVDDEADARQMLEQILLSCKANVMSADSVERAFTEMQREPPHAVISDLAMPELDGYALIRRLRSDPDPRRARVPAIALTAFTRKEDMERAMREGFDHYLPKPVDAAALIERLSQALR